MDNPQLYYLPVSSSNFLLGSNSFGQIQTFFAADSVETYTDDSGDNYDVTVANITFPSSGTYLLNIQAFVNVSAQMFFSGPIILWALQYGFFQATIPVSGQNNICCGGIGFFNLGSTVSICSVGYFYVNSGPFCLSSNSSYIGIGGVIQSVEIVSPFNSSNIDTQKKNIREQLLHFVVEWLLPFFKFDRELIILRPRLSQ